MFPDPPVNIDQSLSSTYVCYADSRTPSSGHSLAVTKGIKTWSNEARSLLLYNSIKRHSMWFFFPSHPPGLPMTAAVYLGEPLKARGVFMVAYYWPSRCYLGS